MQRPRPRRGDAKMWRHPSIGIDLQRWQRENGLFDRRLGCAFKSTIEKSDVGRQPLGFGVCGSDDDSHARPVRARPAIGERLC